MPASTSDHNGSFSGTRPCFPRFIEVVQSKNVFWRKLVVVNCVICHDASKKKMVKMSNCDIPSSMYEGCLNVDTWIKAKRYLDNSLSDTPIRACSRFFVSENFSPYDQNESKNQSRAHNLGQRTRFTTNLNGMPCVLESSFEKWKTLITLSRSSASSSSRGISCRK